MMPISNLDPAVLRQLTNSDLASLALSADQERRRLLRAGDMDGAQMWDAENERLSAEFRKRAA